MVKIVFIGSRNNNRIKILRKIPESKLYIIKNIDEFPNVVIDLIVIDKTNENNTHCVLCNMCKLIKSDKKLNHIPIISLLNSKNIRQKNSDGCDLMVSELVSDIEFDNYVKTMIKMKLMDDELKKEKIILELKVKDRTIEYENKANNLSITLNSIGDGVIVTDANGNINLVNPAAQLVCNFKNENEYLGKKLKQVFKFFIENNEIDIFKIVKNSNKKYKLPTNSILITKNSKLRISDSASPIFNSDGVFNGVVIVFNDVTDDYIMKKNIIESETKYKRLYNNVPDIIYTHTIDGVITNINKNVIDLGYTPEEVLGKNIKLFLDEKNLKIANEKINIKTQNTDLVTVYNIELKTKYNKIKIYEIKSNIIKDNDIRDEIFTIARDITEFINFQNELKKAKDIAESSDNMKSIFISNMTHEIKTPLNSIIGFSSLISEQPISEKIKTYIEMIISSGKLLSDIIDNIIDISDIASGSLRLIKKEFKINDLLYELDIIFHKELILRNKNNIKLILDLNDDLIIYSDYRRIRQIIYEIVMNSIKFTTFGHIKYGYIVKDNNIEFFVKDTGLGIEEKNLDIIFDSFYQINRQQFKKQEGTGLGLTLCKKLSNLFNGDIFLESEYNNGTSVFINLPLEKMKLSVCDKKIDKYKDKKILIVVENKITTDILRLILLSLSLTVEVINKYDYNDVINSLTNDIFDLMIFDIDNLSYNGDVLLKYLKSNNINTPYVLSSNKKSDEKWVIENPINTSQLIGIIKKIFD